LNLNRGPKAGEKEKKKKREKKKKKGGEKKAISVRGRHTFFQLSSSVRFLGGGRKAQKKREKTKKKDLILLNYI